MTRPAYLDRHDIFQAYDQFHARSTCPPREGYLSMTQSRDDSVHVHAPARYTCLHQSSSYTLYSLGSGLERPAWYAVLVARSCLRLLFLALVESSNQGGSQAYFTVISSAMLMFLRFCLGVNLN